MYIILLKPKGTSQTVTQCFRWMFITKQWLLSFGIRVLFSQPCEIPMYLLLCVCLKQLQWSHLTYSGQMTFIAHFRVLKKGKILATIDVIISIEKDWTIRVGKHTPDHSFYSVRIDLWLNLDKNLILKVFIPNKM